MDTAVGRVGVAVLLAACAEPPLEDTGSPPMTELSHQLADRVLSAPGASDLTFHDPTQAVNGVRGGGPNAGGTDVYSLAVDGDAAQITLEWTAGPVFDGEGVDLVVFENPFDHPAGRFMDPVVVEVSVDGQTWVAFPHDYLAADELSWSSDPAHWVGFAGTTPVLLHEESNPVDPLDPGLAGGDGFDLADLDGVSEICCARLWSASEWLNPDSGQPFPRHPIGDGADIDGVYGRVAP